MATTTRFTTHVKPRPADTNIVVGSQPGVRFNPVILNLTANGSEIPGIVKLVATVSSDSAPDMLAFQWSYTSSPGMPDATFAHGGQGNPGWFEGYTVDHQGIITLAVTDEHNGTTTLHYQLARDQLADPVKHASVNSLRRMEAGSAHACEPTGGTECTTGETRLTTAIPTCEEGQRS